MTIDEYTLAALLSQNLADDEERDLHLLLTTDEELREILAMATEALMSVADQTNRDDTILV